MHVRFCGCVGVCFWRWPVQVCHKGTIKGGVQGLCCVVLLFLCSQDPYSSGIASLTTRSH